MWRQWQAVINNFILKHQQRCDDAQMRDQSPKKQIWEAGMRVFNKAKVCMLAQISNRVSVKIQAALKRESGLGMASIAQPSG